MYIPSQENKATAVTVAELQSKRAFLCFRSYKNNLDTHRELLSSSQWLGNILKGIDIFYIFKNYFHLSKGGFCYDSSHFTQFK